LVAALKPRIDRLKLGPASDKGAEMGPIISKAAQQRILKLIDSGVEQGAKLVVDGRDFSLQGYEQGFFVGPTLFDEVTPEMDIYQEEIFGPVLSVVREDSYQDAVDLVMSNPYGNGVAIFTRDGDAARDFAARISVGMVGINVPVPVPLAYHSFGGWKASAFGDLNQHGTDSIRFWTRTKTVTARWPSGIKNGAEFQMPTMG
jgi:malonate-semialdehyde dehydrogenase (acetylating)/methylmalonate-semialdehyde dehydrogenase